MEDRQGADFICAEEEKKMKRHLAISALLLSGLLIPAAAQQTDSTATCTFQDGKQMSIQYDGSASVKNANLSSGKIWTPGEKPWFCLPRPISPSRTRKFPWVLTVCI